MLDVLCILHLSYNKIKGSQFMIGLMLGFIWLPCTGPTLGAAIGMASQGQNLVSAFFIMLMFSIGASFPLLLYAFAGKYFSNKIESFSKFGVYLKKILSLVFLIIGTSIYFGLTKKLEAFILDNLPEWWVYFITSI